MRTTRPQRSSLVKFFLRPRPGGGQAATRRAQLRVEELEPRTVLHAATGNQWMHPELITISFQPDGTNLGGVYSNLVGKFNAKFGSAAAWENQILKAAQTWAQYANINFALVGDSGAPSGSGSFQQGDPGFGDIRVGGFGFSSSSTLALTYLPPPVNNYSVGGDMGLNTNQTYNLGSTYDLFSVALHELGHALGLDHSSSSLATMYSSYNGTDYGLNSDDIAGIRAIYGARVADAFDATASNGSFASASDLTSRIDPTAKTALVTGLDITSTADADYYTFTAPAGVSTLKLNVQSSGLSLLAPLVRVYNASQSQVASVSGLNKYGTTLSLTVNVTPGQRYYVLVDGADNTAFGTGAYAMTLNFGSGASPTVSPSDTRTANGSPTNGGGGLADRRDAQGNVVGGLLSLVGGVVKLAGGLLGGLLGGKTSGGLVENAFFHTLDVSGSDHQNHSDVNAHGSSCLCCCGYGPGAQQGVADLPGVSWEAVPATPGAAGPGADAQSGILAWWQEGAELSSAGIWGPTSLDAGLQVPATARPAHLATRGVSQEEASPASSGKGTTRLADAGTDVWIPTSARPAAGVLPWEEACDVYFAGRDEWAPGW